MSNFDPRWALLRSRHGTTIPAAVALIGLAIVITGRRWTTLPSVTGGSVQLQIWMILATGIATLPAALIDSEISDLEQTATGTHRRHETFLLLIGSVLAAFLLAATVWMRIGDHAALVSLRIFAAWFGLALVSSRLFGTERFWAIPGMLLIVILVTNSGAPPPWTQIIAAAPGHWPSWLYTTVIAGLGMASYAATPWRVAAVRHGVRRHPAPPR